MDPLGGTEFATSLLSPPSNNSLLGNERSAPIPARLGSNKMMNSSCLILFISSRHLSCKLASFYRRD